MYMQKKTYRQLKRELLRDKKIQYAYENLDLSLL